MIRYNLACEPPQQELPMNAMTQSNKIGWDGLAAVHAHTYHLERLLSGVPLLNDLVRAEVGEVRGKSLVHLLCHIGSDTLSWALLGAAVTGIDISPESLKVARRLAEQMGISAEFIEADVMDVMEKVHSRFDIVFASTGVLCWLPDIHRFAQTVRHLLKDGGFFYLLDGHPFRNMLVDSTGNAGPQRIQGDYFRKEVWRYADMGDYTDPSVKIEAPSFEWNWTLGEVVTALCQAGLRLEFLHEFPQYFYSGYTPYDVVDEQVESFPCVFSLKARAE
jgi:SAM-dependent methyltransferase